MNFDYLHTLYEKKMTRREFLILLGVFLFALTGISGVLERLELSQKKPNRQPPKRGFGSGAYGV